MGEPVFCVVADNFKHMQKINKEKEQWIDGVMGSLEGIQRTQAPEMLFDKIKQEIEYEEIRVVPMRRWWFSVAAAIALLALNIMAMQQYIQYNKMEAEDITVSGVTYTAVFSDYQIYD